MCGYDYRGSRRNSICLYQQVHDPGMAWHDGACQSQYADSRSVQHRLLINTFVLIDPIWPLSTKRARGGRSKPDAAEQPCHDSPLASSNASAPSPGTSKHPWGWSRLSEDSADPEWEPEGAAHSEARPAAKKKRGRPPGTGQKQAPSSAAPRSGHVLLQRICQMSEDSTTSR